MGWLAQKRQCLEVALNEGWIPRIDVLQQVVSSFFFTPEHGQSRLTSGWLPLSYSSRLT